jgi:hypothetical protein
MDKLMKRVREVLRKEFPGCSPELEQVRPLKKVGGFLVWDGFEELEQLERQRRLSKALRKHLSPDELAGVTTILTMTPNEVAVMRED